MRVVADANVLASAALARSPQAPSVLTLHAAIDGRLELIISPRLLREIAMVLARPRLQKYLTSEETLRFVTDLAAHTILMTDPPGPHAPVCRDPDDDYLVALGTRSDRVEVERGMDCPCQVDLLLIEQPPDLLSERVRGDGRDVVACDDAAFVETVGGSAGDLG